MCDTVSGSHQMGVWSYGPCSSDRTMAAGKITRYKKVFFSSSCYQSFSGIVTHRQRVLKRQLPFPSIETIDTAQTWHSYTAQTCVISWSCYISVWVRLECKQTFQQRKNPQFESFELKLLFYNNLILERKSWITLYHCNVSIYTLYWMFCSYRL